MKKEQPKVKRTAFLALLIFLLLCGLQWFSLELSATTLFAIKARPVFQSLISISVVLFLNAAMLLMLGSFFAAQLCTSLFFTLLAVANTYVFQLHGSPLRLSELRSAFTAANVIEGYQLSFPLPVRYILLIFLLETALLMLVKRSNLQLGPSVRFTGFLLGCLSLGVILYGFRSPEWRPQVGWSMQTAINTYGYTTVLIEDSLKFYSRYDTPDAYSEAAMDVISAKWESKSDPDSLPDERPDIVLILNETFYDPNVCKSLRVETDRPYLSRFYELENVARGFNAVPLSGTNGTEYELLTSNSSALINPSAPFNFFPLENANSIVRYLASLGYETWAFHNAEPENYSRITAYPAMGFDHVAFYQHFMPETYYGKRRATDSHDYEKLIEAYEAAGDAPRFIYMLTIQNHGGWEQNPEELDTVHVSGDYGDLTDDYNEFLTSISLSDSALQELVDYFSTVDRHVIVVMTGDHPPAFLTGEKSRLSDQKEIVLANMTPYIIWSNYQNLTTEHPYITCSDLVPLTLKTAGLPLSPYYKQILDLQAKLPVHVSGFYFDTDGTLYTSADGLSGESELNDYLLMECNNLQNPSKRRQKLFEP